MIKIYDNGSGAYTVSIGERELSDWRASWPASGLGGLRRLSAGFARNGDLVDLVYNGRPGASGDRWDGPALVALTHDMQCVAHARGKAPADHCRAGGDAANLGVGVRKNARGAPLDQRAADELKLYIDNDGDLYRQGESYRAALEKRMQKGTFDIALAAKGFGWIVDAGAKKYAQTPTTGYAWNVLFPPATRKQVAKEMAEEWASEYRIADDARLDALRQDKAYRKAAREYQDAIVYGRKPPPSPFMPKPNGRKRTSRRNAGMSPRDAVSLCREVTRRIGSEILDLSMVDIAKHIGDFETSIVRVSKFVAEYQRAGSTYLAVTNVKSKGVWVGAGVNDALTMMMVQVSLGKKPNKRNKDFYFPLQPGIWPDIAQKVRAFRDGSPPSVANGRRRTSRNPRPGLEGEWDTVNFAQRLAEKSGDQKVIAAAKAEVRRVYQLMQAERAARARRNPRRVKRTSRKAARRTSRPVRNGRFDGELTAWLNAHDYVSGDWVEIVHGKPALRDQIEGALGARFNDAGMRMVSRRTSRKPKRTSRKHR